MFGLENATITKIYSISNQTKNIYGSPVFTNPTAVSKRVWLEETSDERRESDGDSFSRRANVYSNRLSVNEGDVLEITPDTATGMTKRNWRIEQKRDFCSSVEIYRTDLNLVEETS